MWAYAFQDRFLQFPADGSVKHLRGGQLLEISVEYN
jgi:hypothetical protein